MNISIASTFYEENYVWCTLINDNYLYRLDNNRCVLEEMTPLLDEKIWFAFYDILDYKDRLILVPCTADGILIVNRKSYSKEYIELPKCEECIGESYIKFSSGIVWQDNLFLFGYAYPGIVKLNLVTKELSVIDSWIPEMRSIVIGNDGCFNNECIVVEGKVYHPFLNADAIMEFDLHTEQVVIHRIGERKQGFISIQWDGTNFWLVPRNGEVGAITRWNLDSNEMQYFDSYPVEFDRHRYAFYRTILIENKLFLFAGYGNCNIIFDIGSGRMETFPHLYDVGEVKGCKYPKVFKVQDNILFVRGTEYILWDYKSGNVLKNECCLAEKVIQRFAEREKKRMLQRFSEIMDDKSMCINEGEYWNLKFYLEWIKTVG